MGSNAFLRQLGTNSSQDTSFQASDTTSIVVTRVNVFSESLSLFGNCAGHSLKGMSSLVSKHRSTEEPSKNSVPGLSITYDECQPTLYLIW
jgi:hypothetical protein